MDDTFQILLERLKNNKGILFTGIFFSLLYASISLFNHYNFRTYALDLGLYTNAIFDYSHFHFNDSRVMQALPENILSDHFDLFLMLIAPLYYVFGTYTLLIIQIIAIIIGGIGIYRFTLFVIQNKKIALLAAICFYCFFGIFSAVAFDYHSNVIAAMMVPWFFLFFFQERWRNCTIVFLLILITKENMSLWLVFIGIGLIFNFKEDKLKMRMAFIYSIVSLLWFIVAIKFLMPALSNEDTYAHMDYHALGNSFSEVLKHIITQPVHTLKLLFINHSNNKNADHIKMELHIFVLLSGGILLFFKPQFLIMLIPVYFQKLFHDNISMWGIGGQYSVEFAPILVLGSVCVIKKFESENLRTLIMSILLILIIAVTVRSFDKTYAYVDRSKQRFYQAAHWTRNFDVQQAYTALTIIPNEVSVSAQSAFVPHLADREHIYQFPLINDAEYIVLSVLDNTYPLSLKGYELKFSEIIHSKSWEVIYKQAPIIIFKHI